MTIIPQDNFTSFDDAIAFVQANPDRYVIKPSGEAQNFKQLLFVGEEEDGKDVIQVLEDYKRRSGRTGSRRFSCSAASWASRWRRARSSTARSSSLPVSVNFEHKKLFPGDIGPSTGEMGTTMFWSEPNRIFNATLKKMEPQAARGALRRLHRRELHRQLATASIRSSSRRASAIPRSAFSRKG